MHKACRLDIDFRLIEASLPAKKTQSSGEVGHGIARRPAYRSRLICRVYGQAYTGSHVGISITCLLACMCNPGRRNFAHAALR